MNNNFNMNNNFMNNNLMNPDFGIGKIAIPNVENDRLLKIEQQKFQESMKRSQELRENMNRKYEGPSPVIQTRTNPPYKDPTPWITFMIGESNTFPSGRPK